MVSCGTEEEPWWNRSLPNATRLYIYMYIHINRFIRVVRIISVSIYRMIEPNDMGNGG